ncbi:phosphatase PAP2 family protein [Betaproteobacteria bacterium SCN1]|jgi:membrane-associated phospholipid phosphatase|nr:phosphatase PAP2 family protein [Betaproteobacteria bacterium SCN1]
MDSVEALCPPGFFADHDTVRARLRLVAAAATGLATLAALAWSSGFDAWLTARIAGLHATSGLYTAADVYSQWAPGLFYLPFLAMLAPGLAQGQSRLREMGTAYLAAQLFGAVLLTHLLKMGVDRMRPHASPDAAAGLLHALHSSFPSSHTVDVAIGAFFVLLLVRARGLRLLAISAAVLMGLARLALGRHYASDVLAGLALGAATVALVAQVYLLPRWRS